MLALGSANGEESSDVGEMPIALSHFGGAQHEDEQYTHSQTRDRECSFLADIDFVLSSATLSFVRCSTCLHMRRHAMKSLPTLRVAFIGFSFTAHRHPYTSVAQHVDIISIRFLDAIFDSTLAASRADMMHAGD